MSSAFRSSPRSFNLADEKAWQGHGAGDYGGTDAAKQFPLRYDGEL
jgi:hypothetical protein